MWYLCVPPHVQGLNENIFNHEILCRFLNIFRRDHQSTESHNQEGDGALIVNKIYPSFTQIS